MSPAEAFDWAVFALCMLFAWIMQVDANFVNDYFDFRKGGDTERRLGPKRACAQGWITPGAMKTGILVTTVLACAAGLPLIWTGGPWMIAVGAADRDLGPADHPCRTCLRPGRRLPADGQQLPRPRRRRRSGKEDHRRAPRRQHRHYPVLPAGTLRHSSGRSRHCPEQARMVRRSPAAVRRPASGHIAPYRQHRRSGPEPLPGQDVPQFFPYGAAVRRGMRSLKRGNYFCIKVQFLQ